MLKNELSDSKSIFFLPRDHIAREVLIPAFKSSKRVRILMGYFSSSSFRQISDGLATFLNENDGKLEIIISPFVTNQDRSIMMMDDEERRAYVENSMFNVKEGKENIDAYCLACFGWLLAEGRLDLKIALVDDGLFHMKIWLFDDGEDIVALHGSMNQTAQGMRRNVEQINLSRPWANTERQDEVNRLIEYFEDLVEGKEAEIRLYDLTEATKKNLIARYKEFQPRPVEPINQNPTEVDALSEKKCLRLPGYVNYETGDFAHQGVALQSWIAADMHGIFNMATGSGKTITSLICAHHFQKINNKIMLFISAPQKPLMMQWIEEVAEFNIKCENISEMDGWDARHKAIAKAERLLKYGSIEAAVFVISNTLLKHQKFENILENVSTPKMLIADECHNFGLNSLSEGLKDAFDAKLGLSATPDRQYDELGTEFLKGFLGDICYTFSLDEAIGKCLTPYDYYIKTVFFDGEEMEQFVELTAKIGRLSWQNDTKDSQSLDNLKRQRRKLIETASMKIAALRHLLHGQLKDMQHTLIYCTDKDPEQLQAVNEMLNAAGALYRQVTSEETSSPKLVEGILKSFRLGKIKILTAKRVLDEGVNIPETKKAFVLASNTIERQWTQRRGRILRKCNAVGKESAEIIDFVVLPFGALDKSPGELGSYEKKLIALELPRLREFARLSRNKLTLDGSAGLILKLEELISE